MDNILWRYLPAGYNPEREESIMIFGILCSIVISGISCISNFKVYIGALSTNGQSIDIIIEKFSSILNEGTKIFLVAAILELIFIYVHYKYYTKDSMTIYLVKRVPEKYYYLKTCIISPILRSIIILIAGIVCYVVYAFFILKAGQKILPELCCDNIFKLFFMIIF